MGRYSGVLMKPGLSAHTEVLVATAVTAAGAAVTEEDVPVPLSNGLTATGLKLKVSSSSYVAMLVEALLGPGITRGRVAPTQQPKPVRNHVYMSETHCKLQLHQLNK